MPESLAPAKVNLFLRVGPRRADGYHPICSLMEKVSLFDRVSVEPASKPGVHLRGEALPPGENTVEKAAALLGEAMGVDLAADISLSKQIPVAAGLAGGSSDAAAALLLLSEVFGLDAGKEVLQKIALAVGADVPFFLSPGPQLAEGAGEILTPVHGLVEYELVIATPAVELPTAAVYERYDAMEGGERGHGFDSACQEARRALKDVKNLVALARLMQNDLEPPAMVICPEIAEIKKDMLAAGAVSALMSGSGPSVFGVFAGKKESEAAALALQGRYSVIRPASPIRTNKTS